MAYREIDLDTIVDLDGSLLGAIASQQTGEADFWSEELQVLGTSFDGKLDWIVGLFYMTEDGVDDSSSMQFNELTTENTRIGVYNAVFDGTNQQAAEDAANAAAANAILRRHTSGLFENKATAIYTGLTYRINEKWTIAGGLRYTEDERESTATHRTTTIATGATVCQFTSDGVPLPIEECNPTVDDTWDAWTYDVTLSYDISDASMVYGSLRHGYKTGGFNGRARNDVASTAFDEEKVDEYELGFKADFDLGGASARFSGAIFYQDYTDIQRQSARNLGNIIVTIINNAADATIRGGELELLLIPTSNLQISLFYSNIDGEYDSFIDDLGVDRSDQWAVQAPEHMFGGSLIYTYPMADSSEITLAVTGYGQSSSHLDDIDAISDQKSFGLLNARLNWDRIGGSQFSVGVWGKNLTDKEYGTGNVSILDTGAGTAGRVWGDPLMYGVDVIYHFGE